VPSSSFKTGIWVNLCVDVRSFYQYCYPEDTFQTIEAISLGAFC